MKNVFLILFLLSSCKTITPPPPDPMPPPDACRIAEIIGSAATPTISESLGCQNPAAIKQAVVSRVHKMGWCKESQQSAISEIICAELADVLKTTVFSRLPENWRCDGGKPASVTRDVVYRACIAKISL
jgi:hypothetical protein